MRRYHLYAAVITIAAVLGMAGCAVQSQAAAVKESAAQEIQQETLPETTVEDTVVETASGPIESVGKYEPELPQAVRIYGPVTKLEDGSLSIDNQSLESSSGEIILTVSQEYTYLLDAETGFPMDLKDLQDGSTIYAYIGPAMTMSLPPMTNAEVIFGNIPADFKVPDYVEVKSVITDASTSQSVFTAADGTEYPLAEDCQIYPYLTKNIVTLDDLTQGRKCVVWSGEDNTASRIMVFAE